ncbi:hypothetical protein C8J55DRAFT_87740 [Lentinula edodes]|uniref:Uncharacterized protein n=1 Tax=Lentinula lateritia TaxID=40482 RepID=A0A9W9A9N6_9AGAR|nr:hypothetical protein C8J55DRAFT_87740 [Lentinula edodes]
MRWKNTSRAAAASTPGIRERIDRRLWVDIARYGPTIPASTNVARRSARKRTPGLSDFEIPPPPMSWREKTNERVERLFLLPAPPQPLILAPSADPLVASQLDPIATNQLPTPDYPPPLSPSPLPAPIRLSIFQQVSLQRKRRMEWAIVWKQLDYLARPG